MRVFQFKCGCQFPLENNHFNLKISDIYNLPFNCEATWKLFASGLTTGVFQLETQLGKNWCKELKPNGIEDLAALGSILRPSCLNAKDEKGISLTKHYCLRKNGLEQVEYPHETLEKHLKGSYGLMVFQESVMSVVQELAGFTLSEAYKIIKGIAKKKTEIISQMKQKFLDGCKTQGKVGEEKAKGIFGWIEAGSRYGFNKSHAVSYGVIGWWTAYMKVHFPLAFFTAKLNGAKNKLNPEYNIQELVNDAKLFNLEIQIPDLRDEQEFVYTNGKVIKFGIGDIKGVGESAYKKIKEHTIELKRKYNSVQGANFFQFLMSGGYKISQAILTKMIEAGCLDYLGQTRTRLIREAKVIYNLSKGELELAVEVFNNGPKDASPCLMFGQPEDLLEDRKKIETTEDLLKYLMIPRKGSRKDRFEFLKEVLKNYQNPINSDADSPLWLAYREGELLGVSLTNHKIDSCSLGDVNTTIREFTDGKNGFMVVAGHVTDFKEKAISKGDNQGKKFADFMLDDGTYKSKAILWPDVYEEYGNLLVNGANLILEIIRPWKKTDSTIIVKRVWAAKINQNAS